MAETKPGIKDPRLDSRGRTLTNKKAAFYVNTSEGNVTTKQLEKMRRSLSNPIENSMVGEIMGCFLDLFKGRVLPAGSTYNGDFFGYSSDDAGTSRICF
jgi:hypothetical protein